MAKTIYNPTKLKPLILEGIKSGKSLRKVCEEEGMPSLTEALSWISEDETFAEQYAYARDIRADVIFEEILTISDNQSADVYTDEEGNVVLNTNAVQRNRLQVDSRKWILSKMNPKKYGDKLALGGDDDTPLSITIKLPGAEQ